MLGVPYEDHEFFQHHANVGLARYASAEEVSKGPMSLHKYLLNLVEKKMEHPSEDAVSDLAERVTAGEISVKEAAQLGTGLLIAGHETICEHDRHRRTRAAGEPRTSCAPSRFRRSEIRSRTPQKS